MADEQVKADESDAGAAHVPLRAVLYDLDGTVANTTEVIRRSLRYATRHVLHVIFSDAELMADVGIPTSVAMYDYTYDPVTADELAYQFRWCNGQIHDRLIREYPGMRQTLEGVAALGLSQSIVTSKKTHAAHRSLSCLDYQGFFEHVVSADDVEHPKPAPEPCLMGAEQLGLEPTQCAYVGDSPYDIEAGRGAGMTTIGVTWGVLPNRMRAAEPTYVVDTPAELLDVVRKLV